MRLLEFGELLTLLGSLGESVAILTHERADGDTVGSAIGLSEILSALSKRAKICSPDGIPEHLAFLKVETEEPEPEDDIISVDVPSVGQLGRYAGLSERIVFMIDHHKTGEVYADCYRDGSAAAAGEIVYDIGMELLKSGKINALGERFNRGVYAAISSDTGCFRYSNVTASTHLRAAELVASGIDTAALNRELFDSHSKREIAAIRLAYREMKITDDGKIALITFTKAMQDEASVSPHDLGSIIDIPRSVRGIEAAAVLKQDGENPETYRVSLRSSGRVDVSTVAALFGGGGHRNASGCSVSAGSPAEAEEAVKAAVYAKLEGVN